MERYPKVRYPGEEETRGLFDAGEVYIQEKLDGSNFRFTLHEGEFRFGSRNTEGDQLARDQFAAAIEFIKSTVDIETLKQHQADLGDLVYFGEAMNPHTISYDWDETPEFLGFDVWSVDDEVFLECDHAWELFVDDLGLPYAPIVDIVPASEWDEYDFEVPESAFYDGPAEGVVFKNHTTATYGKFVRDEFKEKSKQKFGASSKKDLTDTNLLVEEYVPPARVRSVAHQLIDDGEWSDLRMEMMEDLPLEVIRDMVDEEGSEIFIGESKTVDLGEFRSSVSSRCAGVLRQMIDHQAREELRANGGGQ